MQLRKLASSALVAGALVASLGMASAAEPENTLILTLRNGEVTIGLRPDLAPRHVEQVKALVEEGAPCSYPMSECLRERSRSALLKKLRAERHTQTEGRLRRERIAIDAIRREVELGADDKLREVRARAKA